VQFAQPAVQQLSQSSQMQPACRFDAATRFAGRSASTGARSATSIPADASNRSVAATTLSPAAQQLVFAAQQLFATGAVTLATAACEVRAAQQTQPQPVPHEQTPVSQQAHPATQSQAQFVHDAQEPPLQQLPEERTVLGAVADQRSPNDATEETNITDNSLNMRHTPVGEMVEKDGPRGTEGTSRDANEALVMHYARPERRLSRARHRGRGGPTKSRRRGG
jgi:hypothetical protein